jgi:hypothetical protein
MLERMMPFAALPREGESVKFANRIMGDYCAFRVDELTHREGSEPELMLEKWKKSPTEYEYLDEAELDEYVASYVAEGWRHESTVPNRDL